MFEAIGFCNIVLKKRKYFAIFKLIVYLISFVFLQGLCAEITTPKAR